MNLTPESRKFIEEWKIQIEKRLEKPRSTSFNSDSSATWSAGKEFGYDDCLYDQLTKIQMLLANNPAPALADYNEE